MIIPTKVPEALARVSANRWWINKPSHTGPNMIIIIPLIINFLNSKISAYVHLITLKIAEVGEICEWCNFFIKLCNTHLVKGGNLYHMKTVNFLKSKSDWCRRKIVITEINILWNLAENHMKHRKIVREMGKLNSLWFKGNAKDMRLAELQDNWQREKPNFMQAHF